MMHHFAAVLILLLPAVLKAQSNEAACRKLEKKYEKCLSGGYNSTYGCHPFKNDNMSIKKKKCKNFEKKFQKGCVKKKGFPYVCRNETEVSIDLHVFPSFENADELYLTCVLRAPEVDTKLRVFQDEHRLKWDISKGNHSNVSYTMIFGTTGFRNSSKISFECYSKKYEVGKSVLIERQNSNTTPILHIRAPSSINHGESSSVTCSITANRSDPSLTMYWGGHRIYRWDDRFKFSNYTHNNGSVETSIEGFPRFNFSTSIVQLICSSETFGMERVTDTRIYSNNTKCWEEKVRISEYDVYTLSYNATRKDCGKLCLSNYNCSAVQSFKNGTCLATDARNPSIDKQWLNYTTAIKNCTEYGGDECYEFGTRLRGYRFKREPVNATIYECDQACNNYTECTGFVSWNDVYCDLYSGIVTVLYDIAAVARRYCL